MVLAIAFCLAAQAKPPVDHSAEPALKALFQRAADLQGAHVLVRNYSRTGGEWYSEGSTTDLYLGHKGQFRFVTISGMGDESLVVSDGLSIMNDPLTDDDAITLDPATKPLHEISPREPLAFLLEGDAGFAKLVDQDQPIVAAQAPSGQEAIEFHAKTLGKIVVQFKDGDPLPTSIALYRSPRRRDEGVEMPYPTTKESIHIVGYGPEPTSLFAISTPKGVKVEDHRTHTPQGSGKSPDRYPDGV